MLYFNLLRFLPLHSALLYYFLCKLFHLFRKDGSVFRLTSSSPKERLFDSEVKGENVDISKENVGIPSENANILPQSKGKENKGKEMTPTNPPRGEVRQEDILSSIPQDGVARNTKGLIEELQRLGIGMSDMARLVGYCNYGEIGHPIWKALVTIRGSNGQIKQPLQYIWARLRKQEG